MKERRRPETGEVSSGGETLLVRQYPGNLYFRILFAWCLFIFTRRGTGRLQNELSPRWRFKFAPESCIQPIVAVHLLQLKFSKEGRNISPKNRKDSKLSDQVFYE